MDGGVTATFENSRWWNVTAASPLAVIDDDADETTARGDDSLALFRFVCEVMISMPIIGVGIVANALAFVVLARQRCRLPTTLLLRCLSVVDILVLVCALLQRCIIVLHTYTGTLHAYVAAFPRLFVCIYPLSYVIRLVDTLITVLLTVDRYIAVCRPLQAHRLCTARRTYRRVAVVCVAALVFSAPRCFEHRVVGDTVQRTALALSPFYVFGYRIFLFSLVMYVAPMALLVVLNARLLRVVGRAARFRAGLRRLSSTDSAGAPSHSVTVTVTMVVVVAVVCNTTALVSHALWSLQACSSLRESLDGPRRYMAHVSNVMVTVNSAVNFAIYCLCSRNFRSKVAGRSLKAAQLNMTSAPPNQLA